MMKLILSVVILYACLSNIAAINGTSEHLENLEFNILSIGDAQSYVDSIVTLHINVDNWEEFVAFQVDLILPLGLDYIDGSERLTGRAQDHLTQASYVGESTLRVISFSLDSLPYNGSSGTIA